MELLWFLKDSFDFWYILEGFFGILEGFLGSIDICLGILMISFDFWRILWDSLRIFGFYRVLFSNFDDFFWFSKNPWSIPQNLWLYLEHFRDLFGIFPIFMVTALVFPSRIVIVGSFLLFPDERRLFPGFFTDSLETWWDFNDPEEDLKDSNGIWRI